ncbi:MAG TPA: NlpC/P60 family protein [Mycobacteriales bacterium]|nr:NlpC/P60 family protein [Mycobacteriales bacterium]
MRRTRTSAVVAACATVAGVIIAGVPVANADPLGDARARAAQLAHSIEALQTQAEVATERYDQAQAQLQQAVAQRIDADQALNAIQAQAATAQQQVADRTRALYESGGDPAMLAAMLGGENPLDAIDRYRMASSVINYEARNAEAAASTIASAAALDDQDAQISSRVTQLQVTRRNEAARIDALISRQQQELAAVNGTIRRLYTITLAAQQAQGAKDFASAVAAAGGTVGSGEGVPPNQTVAIAISWAKKQLGKPYVWGGTGPSSFDCSGLVQYSYAHAGVTLPRVAADQYNTGPHPSLANLEPGDLLFWATDISNPATIHHVTMYLGGGLMIAAPHTGTDVQIQPVYMDGFIGATRPWSS